MSTQNPCLCPQGTPPDGNGNCISVTHSTPILNSTIYTVGPGNQEGVYGSGGTIIYSDITNTPWPIQYGTSNVLDANNNPLTITNSITGSSLWGGLGSATGPPWYGRLNNCGVWTTYLYYGTPGPLEEWIGFTSCIQVSQAGTYCIGMSADNACRFKIDGQIIVTLIPPNPPGTDGWILGRWLIFPITLSAGTHVIQMDGQNYNGPAAFGAEIYNAIPNQLAAMTTQAQLSAVTLFSTINRLGLTFDSGQFSGYICPTDNCTLSLCNGIPSCVCSTSVPIPPCCFQLTNCATDSILITSTDLTSYINSVITIQEQQGCWTVTSSQICTGSIIVTPTHNYGGSCNECLPCYLLTNCSLPTQTLSSNTVSLSGYIGHTVQLQGYPLICWSVTLSQDCKINTPVIVTKDFGLNACESCLCQYYILTDCTGINPPIITTTNLNQYLGQVVKIKGCVDICWMVSCQETGISPIPVIVTENFATCVLCNPPPIIPPVELHLRRIKPGYYTKGCDSEYTETVYCTFANAIYDHMIISRYGVTMCCNEPIMKWDIKRELIDLKAIYDSCLCKSSIPQCCPPCIIGASIFVFESTTSCETPTSVSGTIVVSCETPTFLKADIEVSG